MSLPLLPELLTGVGLGALVAAEVGPVSLLCIRTTLRYGFAPGLAVGAGAAAVDTAYGALGMLGAGALVTVSPVRVAMGAVGAVVGGHGRVHPLGRAARAARARDPVRGRHAGAGVAHLPGRHRFEPPDHRLVGHRVRRGVDGLGHRRLGRRGALLCGICAGSVGWFAVLTTGVVLAGRRLGDRSLQVADTVAGLGLVGFGAALGLRTARDG